MTIVEQFDELFGENVSRIFGGGDITKSHKIAFSPILKRKVSDINAMCLSSGLQGLGDETSGTIVFPENSCIVQAKAQGDPSNKCFLS